MDDFASEKYDIFREAIANNGLAPGPAHEVTDQQPLARTAEPKASLLLEGIAAGRATQRQPQLSRKHERHTLRLWIKAGRPNLILCGKPHASFCHPQIRRRLRKRRGRKAKGTAMTVRSDPESRVQSLSLPKPRAFSYRGVEHRAFRSVCLSASSLPEARTTISNQRAKRDAGRSYPNQTAKQEAGRSYREQDAALQASWSDKFSTQLSEACTSPSHGSSDLESRWDHASAGSPRETRVTTGDLNTGLSCSPESDD